MASESTKVLDFGGLTTEDLIAVANGTKLEVADKVMAEFAAAAVTFERRLAGGERIYGVTTGVGDQSDVSIGPQRRAAYQMETLLAHACGTGAHLDRAPARAVWVAKVASMARARSGCSVDVLKSLVELLNTGLAPVIPVTGSLGASGDLVPSAHAALPLLGLGNLVERSGQLTSARTALVDHGLRPLTLGARDGLSLINGTAATTAVAACAVAEADRVLHQADALVAAGIEAVRGHPQAFDPQLIGARPHRGGLLSAERIRTGLPLQLTATAGPPHEPYSWRCAPQVHGAVLDAVEYLRSACDQELASCSDNPILTEQGDQPLLSGGNFHGAPLGLPADAVTTALATVAGLSRQRTAQLLSGRHAPIALASPTSSGIGLGPLLATSTARTLEIGALTPASSRWLPLDVMEDHVPNSLLAARQALDAAAGLWAILAIEAVCVSTAADLNGVTPHGSALRSTQALVREHLEHPGEPQALGSTLELLASSLSVASVPNVGSNL